MTDKPLDLPALKALCEAANDGRANLETMLIRFSPNKAIGR
jgi:hypothetical protein